MMYIRYVHSCICPKFGYCFFVSRCAEYFSQAWRTGSPPTFPSLDVPYRMLTCCITLSSFRQTEKLQMLIFLILGLQEKGADCQHFVWNSLCSVSIVHPLRGFKGTILHLEILQISSFSLFK